MERRYRHKVTGWSIKTNPKTKRMDYEIHFKRLASQPKMTEVLRRPWTEEIEDYKEYKRLRRLAQEKQAAIAKAKTTATKAPAVTISADGTTDTIGDPERRDFGHLHDVIVFEDDSAEMHAQLHSWEWHHSAKHRSSTEHL